MSTTTLSTIYPVDRTESLKPTTQVTTNTPANSPLWSDRVSIVRTSEHLLYSVLGLGYLIVVVWFIVLFITAR